MQLSFHRTEFEDFSIEACFFFNSPIQIWKRISFTSTNQWLKKTQLFFKLS